MMQPLEQSSARVPPRLVARLAIAAVVVAIVVLLISGSREKRAVSEVLEEIHEIALDKPQGGLIGRWWVSACGSIHIAARSARVVVSHHTDSFQFEMWDVVMARVPEPGEPEDQDTLRVLDRFVLGPLPYTTDIVPDKGGNPLPPLTEN
jgi:hypothetical protein